MTSRACFKTVFSEGKYAHDDCLLAIHTRSLKPGETKPFDPLPKVPKYAFGLFWTINPVDGRCEASGVLQLPDGPKINVETFTAVTHAALARMRIPAAAMERYGPFIKSQCDDRRVCIVASNNAPQRKQELQ